MKALEIKKLTKTYQGVGIQPPKKALIDFSLEVEQGSIFGLLGPNGAGKSTLINILAGMVRKTSGRAKIMGIDIDQNPKLAKSHIGIVPQEIYLDTFFSVYDSLEFYAGYFGIRPENRKTNEILDALGLIDKASSTPRSLSGGMKRRFLVAKAMVHSPPLLILDEPTAGVDLELRDQLWDYVTKLNKKGTTIIITTHYLEEAEKLCDKIGFISAGKLAFCDTKERLLSNLSQKEMKITLTSNLRDIPDNLAKYQIIKPSPNVLCIKYNKNKTAIGEIINDIGANGLQVKDISINEGSLEDIFRDFYRKNS
ncbi:MAG: ABC transporter ATP-binding protein [Rickettsiaceae bacterium]|nr:ABC transporter ATP-binding protein [Rickettsiaceae bacterium]